VDAVINLALGALLLTFPRRLVQFLGVPGVSNSFYPSILGGVLIGIGLALVLEYRRTSGRMTGLGLGGALTINLCAALVLAGWLLSGKLDMPFRGRVVLWALVIILGGVSAAELSRRARKKKTCAEDDV
jgi:hypothetical protein